MTFASCLAKNSVTIRLECDDALLLTGGDALHTQNMNHNVLSRSIRDVESLCYLSNANMTFFEHNFLHFFGVIVVNRGGWTTCMRQVFYDLTTSGALSNRMSFLRHAKRRKERLQPLPLSFVFHALEEDTRFLNSSLLTTLTESFMPLKYLRSR